MVLGSISPWAETPLACESNLGSNGVSVSEASDSEVTTASWNRQIRKEEQPVLHTARLRRVHVTRSVSSTPTWL